MITFKGPRKFREAVERLDGVGKQALAGIVGVAPVTARGRLQESV